MSFESGEASERLAASFTVIRLGASVCSRVAAKGHRLREALVTVKAPERFLSRVNANMCP